MKDFLKHILIVGLCLGAAFWGGFLLRDAQWQAKHDDYISGQQRAAETAQRALDADIAGIGLKHEQELENERKTISDLRAGLRDGTVRLRQTKAQCRANEDQRASMGDVERAESGDGEQELGQDILDLAEYTKTAIAQRDALQEIIRKVNDED